MIRSVRGVALNSTNKHAWLLSDLEAVEKKGITVFSTFACGGGSTMGYKLSGCNVIGANDIDPQMAMHYKKNHNPKYYYLCSIKELKNKDLSKEIFDIDILDGSPPCSTFSISGKREKSWGKNKKFREGQTKQVLSDLFFDFIDFAEYIKPKAIIAENVKGLIIGNAKGYLKLINKRLKEIGYRPQVFLVNAAFCNVPQRRERVFIIALRKDIDRPLLRLKFDSKSVTVWDACHDIQNLNSYDYKKLKMSKREQELWRHTKRGDSFAKASKKLFGKESNFNRIRLSKNKPSNTLVATADVRHWDECRKLTIEEYKRLGSFPDDYWVKSENLGKYIIGMSVPPKMMQAITNQIIDQWLSK